MNKLFLYMMLVMFVISLYALQMDEEMAMHVLFDAKHSVNRAAHAAAQQSDFSRVYQGGIDIDETAAQAAAVEYLAANLQLQEDLTPAPNSFYDAGVELVEFEVIHSDSTFPYTYTNAQYNYSVTLRRPGVILIIKVVYPRLYNLLDPIEWTIAGSSELVF